MTEQIFYNEAGKPFIDKELKHPANWVFDYKNIKHVAMHKEFDTQREFEDSVIQKYEKIANGTYPKKHHFDNLSDLNQRYFQVKEGIEKLGQKIEQVKVEGGETELVKLRAEVEELKKGKSPAPNTNGRGRPKKSVMDQEGVE